MQPEVRLRHGREPRREHTQQHTARRGAGWQAHPSELCRCPARRSRSRLRPRAQLAIIRLFGDAAARAPTCGTCPARTPRRIPARIETVDGPHRAPCTVAGLQLGLERTDARCVPQRGSETKRVFFSDLAHLSPDLASPTDTPHTWRPPLAGRDLSDRHAARAHRTHKTRAASLMLDKRLSNTRSGGFD